MDRYLFINNCMKCACMYNNFSNFSCINLFKGGRSSSMWKLVWWNIRLWKSIVPRTKDKKEREREGYMVLMWKRVLLLWWIIVSKRGLQGRKDLRDCVQLPGRWTWRSIAVTGVMGCGICRLTISFSVWFTDVDSILSLWVIYSIKARS